ncbi:hypothetical protein EDD11_010525 [Mortierella claussenii]|nr:hypothetical protein EDD11_010525 [Mortierella claussenii]
MNGKAESLLTAPDVIPGAAGVVETSSHIRRGLIRFHAGFKMQHFKLQTRAQGSGSRVMETTAGPWRPGAS